jgi:hypothetical protein
MPRMFKQSYCTRDANRNEICDRSMSLKRGDFLEAALHHVQISVRSVSIVRQRPTISTSARDQNLPSTCFPVNRVTSESVTNIQCQHGLRGVLQLG